MDKPWPTRPDGTNKTMGEMTHEERREQWRRAVERAKPGFARMGVAVNFAALSPTPPTEGE